MTRLQRQVLRQGLLLSLGLLQELSLLDHLPSQPLVGSEQHLVALVGGVHVDSRVWEGDGNESNEQWWGDENGINEQWCGWDSTRLIQFE